MDINEFLIDENSSLIVAMSQLDKVAKKVLFVTKESKFVASLTDGDLRRWILKKGNLEAKVYELANYKPKYLSLDQKHQAKEFMRLNSIQAVPIVDTALSISSIVFLNDKDIEIKSPLNAPIVIMAGGYGKRLYPYTKILPKPLIPIGEIPIVEHIINQFVEYSINHFHMIVNHKKNMIKAYFNEINSGYSVDFIDEDEPLGTGGGLSLLKDTIKSTFILSNCDILIKEDYKKIFDFHKNERNLITMVCSLKNFKIPYGVIEISETGEIESMKEKPQLTFFTNTGMYVVESKVVEELEDNTFIGFPDIIEKYKLQGERVGIYPISEESWLDMGELDEMQKMQERLKKDG